MISRVEAEQIAYRYINRADPAWPDRPEMIVVNAEERDFGWIFHWTSRPHHETGDFKHAIAGNGPVLVSKENGSLVLAGTAAPLEDGIAEAARRLLEGASDA